MLISVNNRQQMEDFAVIVVSDEQVPKDLETLKNILIEHELEGHYSIEGEFLMLNNEEGDFEFTLFASSIGEPFGMGPGIEIAGEFEDVVSTLMELREVLENAFPGGEFSSAYDE